MVTLFFYSLLSASMFYLGSRAKVTEMIWSRYPAKLTNFMDCAACTGFWWGMFWSATLGPSFDLAVAGLAATSLITPLVVGLCMIVLAPIAAGLMQHGLDYLGHVQDGP